MMANVFTIWQQNYKEQAAKSAVELFVDHYDVPLYTTPSGLEFDVNLYHMAKYGAFTCHDAVHKMGHVSMDFNIIE